MNYVWISNDKEFSNNQIFKIKIIETGDKMEEMKDQYILAPINDEYCESVILANDEALEIVTEEEIAALKYNL
jgi:hypothetical protein